MKHFYVARTENNEMPVWHPLELLPVGKNTIVVILTSLPFPFLRRTFIHGGSSRMKHGDLRRCKLLVMWLGNNYFLTQRTHVTTPRETGADTPPGHLCDPHRRALQNRSHRHRRGMSHPRKADDSRLSEATRFDDY
jgi:hypothetical protein